MAYRLGPLTVHDPDLSALELTGDGFAAAGELVTLVVDPTVQSRLGMTANEARQARETVEAYRRDVTRAYAAGEWLPPHRHPEVRRARAEAEAELATLLGPHRSRRLHQASWRVRNADALLDDEVAEALGLSEEQRQALLVVMDANESGKAGIFEEIRPLRLQSPQQLQELGRRYEDAGTERLLAVLTEQQRQSFEKLKSWPGDG